MAAAGAGAEGGRSRTPQQSGPLREVAKARVAPQTLPPQSLAQRNNTTTFDGRMTFPQIPQRLLAVAKVAFLW